MKIHYLEERLDQTQPETQQNVAKQNVMLKVEVHTLEQELKKTKKLTLRLESELGTLAGSAEREKELEALLADRERDLRELRKSRRGDIDADEKIAALQAAEDRVADLEETCDALETELKISQRGQENQLLEIESLQDAIRDRPDGLAAAMEEIEEMRHMLSERDEAIENMKEDFDETVGELEGERLQKEELQRRMEGLMADRSQSRAALYEQQEERETMENEVNGFRDRLARAALELEMKEEQLDQRNRELEDINDQFREEVAAIENDWRGEVAEQRAKSVKLENVRQTLGPVLIFVDSSLTISPFVGIDRTRSGSTRSPRSTR